jgi:small subunit ribosomal protein S21
MIIIKVSNKLPLERALKSLKRKFDNTKTIKKLRDKKQFTKKSVKRREEIKKAIYKQQNGIS